METEFLAFLMKYGEMGARDKFEDMCTRIAQSFYPEAQPVKADPGDFGIDIFTGDLNTKINVYQCKFFARGFGDSQKSQIRDSFKTAVECDKYEMNSWTLCIPINLNLEQHKWWAKWSAHQRETYRIKIRLINASMLIGLSKKIGLFNELFEKEEILKLDKILSALEKQDVGMKEVLKKPKGVDYSGSLFIHKLNQAGIDENHKLFQDEFYNAEILKENLQSKGIESELEEFNSLTQNVHRLWVTQYIGYTDKENGGGLLSQTYSSIEEHYDRSLHTKLIRVSEIEKRGILHQLSDKCEIGWVKDYKSKL